MITQTDDLRRKLDTIIRTRITVEPAVVLKQMLEKGELSCRTVDGSGKQRWSCSNASPHTLDRIEGMANEVHQSLFDLFVSGEIEFVAGDLGRGLDVYWLIADMQ